MRRHLGLLVLLAAVFLGRGPGFADSIEQSTVWIQTNGPQGGRIADLAVDRSNPSRAYAVGSRDGIYRSTDGGISWTLVPFTIEVVEPIETIVADPGNAAILIAGSNNDFIRSVDGGTTWHDVTTGIDPCTHWVETIATHPGLPGHFYVGGGAHCEVGGTVYASTDGGASWQDIGSALNLPPGVMVESLTVGQDGILFAGANDRRMDVWQNGRVFRSKNAGMSWEELDYGQAEPRLVWSVFANPYDPLEVWVSEGPRFNQPLSGHSLYRSGDGGDTWSPVTVPLEFDPTQRRVLAAAPDGRIYIADGGSLSVTSDDGDSFTDVSLPDRIVRFDLYHLAVHPEDPDRLLLPTGAGGIATSPDGGATWELTNEGIVATSINQIATDPVDPARLYAASAGGEGTFRSDDYGESWTFLNEGGIVHPFADELVVDPQSPETVWFISDVPYIHRSHDRGATWNVLAHPYRSGDLNFFSIYALGQSRDPSTLYALSNGFGIFKGHSTGDNWDWQFLRESEVDYTYTLAVDPSDDNVIYAGHTRKPFEESARIRASVDGGATWDTSLSVATAEAFTSIAVDPTNRSRVFAASTGTAGGIWRSEDSGHSWAQLGAPFDFTTVHAYAQSSDRTVLFAGVWGGGTWRSTDRGSTWQKLESPSTFSAAAIAVDPGNADVVYVADRTNPTLHRSVDGGATWDIFWEDVGRSRRLMHLAIDPTDSDRLYVSTMLATGVGTEGSLVRIQDGIATDIAHDLPRLVLSLSVDPDNPSSLLAVLHERGIYRSDDQGTTWTDISGPESGLPDSGFLGLTRSPSDPDLLYLFGGSDIRAFTFASAGLDPDSVNGVYRSTDNGVTWSRRNGGVLGAASGAVKALAFDPADETVLYASADRGLFVSPDGGETWERDASVPGVGISGTSVGVEEAVLYTNGAGVFAGTRTSPGVIDWSTRPALEVPIHFAQVLPHPSQAGTLYASAYPGGIYTSTDGGATWSERNFGLPSFAVEDPLREGYYALAISNSDPTRLYLGLYGRGVYRSDNGAVTWRPAWGESSTLSGAEITALSVDPQDANAAVVATNDAVYQSHDGGGTWSNITAGLPTTDIRVLHHTPAGNLLAGSRGFGLFAWNGATWEPQNPGGNWGVIWPIWNDRPLYQYTSLLIDPTNTSRVLLGTFPQGIYASDDGGTSWRESNIGWTMDGVFSLVPHPNNPDLVFAGTYNGMNRSLDFGKHWEIWDNGMPEEQWVFSIDFDPANPEVMYACSKNGEDEGQGREDFRGTVMKTTDGGANWFEIVNGIGREQEYYKIIVDRFAPETLYLAAQIDGMLVSRNGGASWSTWNEGLTNTVPGTNGNNVTNTLAVSADHAMLYFGSAGSGVFRRMIAPILPVHQFRASGTRENITVTWGFDDINGNLATFRVYRDTEPITDFDVRTPIAVLTSSADSSYVDTEVLSDAVYYYAVTTVDDTGFENLRSPVLGPVRLSKGPPADFNEDGAVGFADFVAFATRFGSSSDAPGFDDRFDLDGDGRVGFLDFVQFAAAFGDTSS